MTPTPTPDPLEVAREALLPCPFCDGVCDGPNNYGDSGDGKHRFVSCRDCGANIYRFRPEPRAADTTLIEAWNTRILTTAQSSPTYGRDDAARFDWLNEQVVDVIYFDDGHIIDVMGNDVRRAIDDARARIVKDEANAD